MNKLIESLHAEAKERAKHFRKAESNLLEILIRLDEARVFVHLGYPSLYEYCLRELGLSESNSCNFIAVSRKAREIPQLKSEIQSGNISISKARKLTPVITGANAPLWLERAKTLTHKALEREVAREKPEASIPEIARYISEDRVALQLSVSEELMDAFSQLKDLLSQKKRESVSLEMALEVVVGEYLERHHPVKKAKRALKRQKNPSEEKLAAKSSAACGVKLAKKDLKNWFVRQGLKNMVKHQVMYRDRGRCTYVYPNGQRCKEQRYLEMHHLKMISQGGLDTPENLTLLCSAHHKHMHLRTGKVVMPVRSNSDQVGFWE